MSKKKPPVAAPTAPVFPTAPFPRTGTINFHDTHVAIWEDWEDQPGATVEDKEALRQSHFRGVEAAFGKLIDHLRARGFSMQIDPKVQKNYPSIAQWRWVGKKGGLEVKIEVSGRTSSAEFFQNVTPPDNPNGGQYDFNKFQRMPRDMRLLCAVEMVALIRAMQHLGYTFGPRSDLYEPLARAVLRKAEGREQEGLSPLDRHNHGRHPRDRITSWPEPGPYDRKDKDGALLRNGDVRYFYDYRGRLVRGQVFNRGGNCWVAHLADGTWMGQPANGKLFSTDRPDLLPRRVVEETQVSRVSRELGHARSVQARLPGSPAPLARKLPAFLAWMTPLLWAGAVASAAARVAVLEGVLARLAAGERGYYILSLKERDRQDKHLTFFRQNAAGYTWSLMGAGRFQEPEIRKSPSYYDNEESTLAVPCEAVERLTDAGGCVPNTKANLAVLLRAAGEARGARGQSSVKAKREADRKADRAAQKAQPARTTEAA